MVNQHGLILPQPIIHKNKSREDITFGYVPSSTLVTGIPLLSTYPIHNSVLLLSFVGPPTIATVNFARKQVLLNRFFRGKSFSLALPVQRHFKNFPADNRRMRICNVELVLLAVVFATAQRQYIRSKRLLKKRISNILFIEQNISDVCFRPSSVFARYLLSV